MESFEADECNGVQHGGSTDAVIALAQIDAGLDVLLAGGCVPADGREAGDLVRRLERLSRRAAAAQSSLLAEITARGLFVEDGHTSPKVMVRHLAKVPGTEANAQFRRARMARHLPAVASAHAAGDLGTSQINLLARTFANPRLQAHMADAEPWFLQIATELSFRQFEQAIKQWATLADQEGSEPRQERAHDHRDAKLFPDSASNGWKLSGRFGSMQGAAMKDIFDHYYEAETLADWEKARAEHGEKACAGDLPRTVSQRRADALWQIFQDAASAPEGAVPPGWVHNVKWTAEAYEEMLSRMEGNEANPLDPTIAHCTTPDGTPLNMREAAANSLLARFRRIVVNAAGVVIDQGAARTFTGNAKHAARYTNTTCYWHGCEVPVDHCQTDHLKAHSQGGKTNPNNGGPLCGRHNRWKQQGFTVWRDPTGQFHILRPDGTELPP